MSYYRTIDGQRYDAALLDRIQELIAGQGDGRVSYEDAQHLVAFAQDGQGITDTERQTLAYLVAHYNWTDKAKAYLEGQVQDLPVVVAPVMDLRFGQMAREQYQRLRLGYWQAQLEGVADDPWGQYLLGRPGELEMELVPVVQEALWFYDESVAQADWGSVYLYQMPIADNLPPHCSFYAIETSTDGDDGWVELYLPTGEALGFGRTYIELVYWGERTPNRRYVRTGGFPKAAAQRQQRTIWNKAT